uniref:long-chain-fatty-acid--CoA ligase n=1 Tax=Sinocyclocheilus anshuiensis TaxID=1608454 RepID=A0A671NSG5_9TELE
MDLNQIQSYCTWYIISDCYIDSLIRYGARLEIYRRTSRVVTVVDRFVQQAQRIPEKAFLIYEGVTYTYGELEERSNRVARVFGDAVKEGDTVALLMSNEPDFLSVWFGFCKLGCAVAFLNTNIRSRSLLHCFRCCGAELLVVGAGNRCICRRLRKGMHSLCLTGCATSSERRSVRCLRSPTLYIFTSGTTGLPKAAVITHLQALKAAGGFWVYGATGSDVIYTPLPLYHSAASLVGIGGTIELGATCVLKKKFSASQFWHDCRKHNVTIFQYIGELCRYLCNQPTAENEKDHRVLMGVGNGLRQDVWREFHRRFGDIRMCEIYGSTEGNLCFMNHIGKIGAVGRSNFFYKLIFKYDLVKYDLVREEPVRDHSGFCQHVQKGETGLLLSKICSQSPFFGYAGSKQLTEKKILRDVFVTGDAYFNTGDLMAEDEDDFICFRDRVGDTFRWKGENVATTEVTEILGLVDFIQEASVYGVQVPGNEGRAGMAAVIVRPECTFDGKKLFSHVLRELPSYARPLFIRLQESLEMTSTFKQQKFALVESGFDPCSISQPLFFLDCSEKSYVPLTSSVYDSIVSGQRNV